MPLRRAAIFVCAPKCGKAAERRVWAGEEGCGTGGPRKSAFCRISRHWEKAKTILTDFDTEGIEEANVLSKIASRGGCWFLLEIGTFAKQ